GDNWYRGFLARHPQLKTKLSRPLEKCRAQALNKVTVERFFALLAQVIEEFNIDPRDIFNMDEKGIQLGVPARESVII
ncbi:hypothetical protein EV714DRAFT_191453, partial [Schizophyllum commune]